jgi:protein O-GlcNAc transferase
MDDPHLQQSSQLAQQQHRVGQLDQAEVHYRQVLHIQSIHPDAPHGLGLLAHHSGQYDSAVRLISEAIRIYPAKPHYYSDLALFYQVLHHGDLAIVCYQQAITLILLATYIADSARPWQPR